MSDRSHKFSKIYIYKQYKKILLNVRFRTVDLTLLKLFFQVGVIGSI